MTTNKFQHQVDAAVTWCTAVFGRFIARTRERSDRDLTGTPAEAAGFGAFLIAGGVLVGVGGCWLAYQVCSVLLWLLNGHAGTDIAHLPIVRVALDPLTAWVNRHALGEPVSSAALLATWGLGGTVLAVAGMAGSRGARIAWPLYGAATAAMAWFGATVPHRPIAAGLIALAWALVSILVLHRGHPGEVDTHLTLTLPAVDHEPVSPDPDRPRLRAISTRNRRETDR